MRDFDESTLWRISEFERLRAESGSSGYARLQGTSTVLPTTLVAELRRMEATPRGADVMEVVTTLMRQRENALMFLAHEGLVWPLTLFPREWLYHSPRDLLDLVNPGVRELRLLSVEPPGVRPPGHWQGDRVTAAERYRPLDALLWALALHGPRATLLGEIAGVAAYRISANFRLGLLPCSGALGPAVQRLRLEIAPLREIAQWPGMDVERACRLLNALYLQNGLMVLRSHPTAADEQAAQRGWLERWRNRR